eukprot:COSAG06_NODE_36889_length_441_cov_2.967836_1_plen_80_part_10
MPVRFFSFPRKATRPGTQGGRVRAFSVPVEILRADLSVLVVRRHHPQHLRNLQKNENKEEHGVVFCELSCTSTLTYQRQA